MFEPVVFGVVEYVGWEDFVVGAADLVQADGGSVFFGSWRLV